jgi:hypothetical protein
MMNILFSFMSMRNTNSKLTLCEVLRQINDRLQGVEFNDIRDLLALAEEMAKRMARKLYENNKEFDKSWWNKNPDQKEKFERELNTYLIGDANKAKILLEKDDNDLENCL